MPIPSAPPDHVRFRVLERLAGQGASPVPIARYHTCDEFLQARFAGTLDLWHPVKNLSCVIDALERAKQGPIDGARDSSACSLPSPSVSVLDSSLYMMRKQSIRFAEQYKRWEETNEKFVARMRARERAARVFTLATRNGLNISTRTHDLDVILSGYPPLVLP